MTEIMKKILDQPVIRVEEAMGRKTFYVDVGDMNEEEAKDFLKKAMEEVHEGQTVMLENDPTHFSATLNNDGTVDTEDLTPDSGNDDALRFNALAAVQAALNSEPSAFEDEIKAGLGLRIQDAIERKRDEIAQAIFGNEDQEVDTDNDDATPEDEEDVSPEAPDDVEEKDAETPEE